MFSIIFGIIFFPLILSSVTLFFLTATLNIRLSLRQKVLNTPVQYPKSVILVPYYNENPSTMVRALQSIEAQDYPNPLYVMLLNDGSTNTTLQEISIWIQEHGRRHHYELINLDKNSGAKGKAMDQVLHLVPEDAEVLAIVDSDTRLEPDAMRLSVKQLMSDERYAAVSGCVIASGKSNSLLSYIQYYEHIGSFAAIRFAQSWLGLVDVLSGAFSIHRMAAIRELGGWSNWLVEDISWTWKAIASDYRIGYCPEAIAYTEVPQSVRGLFQQRRRWARGRLEALKAAWAISKPRTLLLLPWLLLWIQGAIMPSLLAVVLALFFQQWWVFAIVGLIGVMQLWINVLLHYKHLDSKAVNIRDVILQAVYFPVFEIAIMPASIFGFMDELFNVKKHWLTR
ncbi:glycosyltransferase family 2 protein [Iodobacter sp. HSC-16F04]|uniref:Glycosyltransferase family 2 protein n=1 Tax=Iodobacter violaceini TaxID=3044271 RepID=A0ABX0KSW0_9NEIS|nr:glycosyltransferase family 2 protein [Iodobacter violacea]NHQ85783.1 glycosyltransferase family 2 protein [Iodobacter violacea]